MVKNESSEDYLESILMLSKEKPVVRSVDIASKLGYKKSSVSIAMKNLREQGHITVSPEGYISLTESGLKIANKVYDRHEVITDWFVSLGVNPVVAEDDACHMEHILSDETYSALKKYIEAHK